MATPHSKSANYIKTVPTVFVLLASMLIPLYMTLYFGSAGHKPMRGLFPYAYEILNQSPLFSSFILVSQWLPFATLILLAAAQSLNRKQFEVGKAEHHGSDIHIYPFDGQGAQIA